MIDTELPEAPGSEPTEKKKGLHGRVQQGVGAAKQFQADRAEKKAEAIYAQAEALRSQRQALLDRGYELYEYRAISVRQKIFGDKIDVGEVDQTLNQWASQGWRVKSITEASVGGRLGPGGVSGLMIVFERRIANA